MHLIQKLKKQLIILWISLQGSLNLREILVENYTEELDILEHCIHLSSDSYVDMITSNFELECHFIMLTTNLYINLTVWIEGKNMYPWPEDRTDQEIESIKCNYPNNLILFYEFLFSIWGPFFYTNSIGHPVPLMIRFWIWHQWEVEGWYQSMTSKHF